MSEGWWSDEGGSPYTGIAADLQLAKRSPEEVAVEVAFVARSLGVDQRPGRVLDVPCGGGDISLGLARLGCEVVGVDITERLLAAARERAEAEDQSITLTLHRADMRDVSPERIGMVDGVACWWGSFGYFDDDDNLAFLRALASVLRPGGRLVMDTHVEETLLASLTPPRIWWRAGETYVLIDRRHDPLTRRTETDWTYLRDGRRETAHTSIRLYRAAEVGELVARAGLESVGRYGAISERAFGPDAERLYLVAQKPPTP